MTATDDRKREEWRRRERAKNAWRRRMGAVFGVVGILLSVFSMITLTATTWSDGGPCGSPISSPEWYDRSCDQALTAGWAWTITGAIGAFIAFAVGAYFRWGAEWWRTRWFDGRES